MTKVGDLFPAGSSLVSDKHTEMVRSLVEERELEVAATEALLKKQQAALEELREKDVAEVILELVAADQVEISSPYRAKYLPGPR